MMSLIKGLGIFIYVFIIFMSSSFAEDLTITTYYPSPYGSYNELDTNRLVLNPLTDAPLSPKTGTIYLKNSDKKLYIYDGTAWRDLLSVDILLGELNKSGSFDITAAWANVTGWTLVAYDYSSLFSTFGLRSNISSFGRGLYAAEACINYTVTAGSAGYIRFRLYGRPNSSDWSLLDQSEDIYSGATSAIPDTISGSTCLSSTFYQSLRNNYDIKITADRQGSGTSGSVDPGTNINLRRLF